MYACKDVFHSFRAVYIYMCSFSIVYLPVAIFDQESPSPSLLTSITWDFQPLTHHLGFPATDPREMGFPTPPNARL